MKRFTLIFVAAVLVAVCALGLTACNNKIADNTEHFTSVTKTLKLSKSYAGKKLFSSDGIGAATLIGDTTDGDTSNFSLVEGGSVTVRYQGVDTPESTAGVEKWGKAASKFTNERLHEATEIVIESASGGVPEKDSVGQRSLCYVWYKTADHDFYLLNLELVENGYSYNKESANNAYYKYFQKAEKFARSVQLRMFSKLDDPLFDTDAVELSLKDLAEHPDNYQDNTKVTLRAYMSDMYTASSGAVTFTIGQYDEASGASYSLKLYAGHTESASNMRVGDLYFIAGTLQKYDGNWQISGVMVDNDRKDSTDISWRAQLSYYLVFDSSNDLYKQELTSNCYGDVTVTSVSLEGSVLTFTGTAPKIDGDNPAFTFTVTVPEGYSGAIKEGSVLSVRGCYQFTAGSGQLTVANYSAIIIK